jgi:hypothetical protein
MPCPAGALWASASAGITAKKAAISSLIDFMSVSPLVNKGF